MGEKSEGKAVVVCKGMLIGGYINKRKSEGRKLLKQLEI